MFIFMHLLLLLQAPEYAGYALTEKLFSFRTPQAEKAAQAAQAGEDHMKIAEEFAAATKGAGAGELFLVFLNRLMFAASGHCSALWGLVFGVGR